MRENLGHVFLISLLFVEFYIFIVEVLILHLHGPIVLSLLIGAFLLVLYWMAASNQAPIKEEDRLKFLRKFDLPRLELSIVLILWAPILTQANQIIFDSKYSSDLFAFILAIYFAGFSLAIDGIIPQKQDLIPIETQIEELAKNQVLILQKIDDLPNKIGK